MEFEEAKLQVYGSPQRYYQGPGLIESAGELIRFLGNSCVLVTDTVVEAMIRLRLQASLDAAGIALGAASFTGELTPAAVDRMADAARTCDAQFVIAAGGGKGIDAGKAVAHRLALPLVTMPTAASTDSPTSKNYVLYDDDHRMVGVFHLDRNPDSVIVDTAILAQAPRHLLGFGIGDALAKLFEAKQCARVQGRNMFGHQPTLAALALAQACHDTLRTDAEAALSAAGSGIPTPAFERVVEATILLAGLGFESGGLSVTHALTRGLPRLPGLGSVPHGHLIAYGLMVQLKLEVDSAATHAELYDWLPRLGLPRCLSDLTTEQPTEAHWQEAAQAILAAPHMANFERAVTADELIAAMRDTTPRYAKAAE